MNRQVGAIPLVVIGCVASLLAAQRAAQPPRQEPPKPVFRTAVNYVEADVIVLDDEGKPVVGLTADDFEVSDSGERQTIADFSFVEIPVDQPEPPVIDEMPIERDVQANSSREGRLYVIVIDDRFIDAAYTFHARRVAKEFIEHRIGANDLAAVIYTGSSAADSQDVTSDRDLLLASAGKVIGQAGYGAYASMLDRRMSVNTLIELANFLGTVKIPRRAVVLISQKVETNTDLSYFDRLVDAARRAGVAFYPIDPRGLDPDPGLSGGLLHLAEDTGGFAIINTNYIDKLTKGIVTENSTYYRIGYYSTVQRKRDERPKVRVKRENTHVRVRGGAAPDPAEVRRASANAAAGISRRAVDEALKSASGISGVPMKVHASAFRGSGPKSASVAVVTEIDITKFPFTEKDGRLTSDPVLLRFVATDAVGKVWPAERVTVDLKMRPETLALAREHGVRVLSHLTVPPGRYQLRVAAGQEDGEAGSVVYDLEVPEFDKAALSMSSVLVASAATAETFTVRPVTGVAGRWWADMRFAGLPPTTSRTFAAQDVLLLTTEVYEKAGGPAREVTLIGRLLGSDCRAVREVSVEAAEESALHPFQLELPLEDVQPGRYILQVEAQASGVSPASVTRNIEIRIK